mgnify:CR=1 FL=1
MLNSYNRDEYRNAAFPEVDSQAQSLYRFMSRVYGLMGAGLLMTGAAAYFVAGSSNLINIFVKNSPVFFGLLIVEVLMVIVLSAFIRKMSAATAAAWFIAYSLVNGITMSVIFMVYTKSSIAATFFITAGGFGGLSLFGYMTKRSLGWIGNFCLYALFGIIIASLVNIFLLKSSMFDYCLAYIGVLVFAGLTAYDTQNIKQLGMSEEGEEMKQRYAVIGALELYLDFINLFLFLLRIFGGRK